MPTPSKITVSFEPHNYDEEYDFGLFPPSKKKNTIKVPKDQWTEYVEARESFEVLHDALINLAKKK